MKDLITSSILFAKTYLAKYDGGHDWSHTERVWKIARTIQEKEKAGDLEVIEAAAILHDIADTKFHKGSEEDGGNIAYDFLTGKGLNHGKADHVRRIINNMSFKKRLEKDDIDSLEFQIVQDADRIDAIGAIGIARAFNYGGFKNRALYDPDIELKTYQTIDAYKKSDAPTINHFYEKLFLLKDMMNTDAAKAMAEERHVYMEQFVERFMREWEGM